MSRRTIEEPSSGRLFSDPEDELHKGDLETRIRRRMRLHPMIRAIREFGPLSRVVRAFGRYAEMGSQFWRQLFAGRKS